MSMRHITRELVVELRYQHYTKRIYLLVLVLVAGVLIAFTGSLSHARGAHTFFLQQVETYKQNGVSVEEALAAPMSVTIDGNQETVDNPLKYDFLQVGESLAALKGTGMVGTSLDLVTFVFMPLTFLMYGAWLALYDDRARTSRIRAVRGRWPSINAARLTTIVIAAAASVLLVSLAALAVSYVGAGAVRELEASMGYPTVVPESVSPLWAKLLLSTGVAVLFGMSGYAIGLVTRSLSWPMVLAALVLFLLPFVGAWDPRNLLAVVGRNVYDFWGQFELRPPLLIDTGTAALGLLGYALVAVGITAACVLARRRFP